LAPFDVGLKTTLIVQEFPTATDVPQVLVSENCPVFAPVSLTLVIGSASVPVFVNVIDCAGLLVP
jgi:hypothetical protein